MTRTTVAENTMSSGYGTSPRQFGGTQAGATATLALVVRSDVGSLT